VQHRIGLELGEQRIERRRISDRTGARSESPARFAPAFSEAMFAAS